jgi:hypothetical protein
LLKVDGEVGNKKIYGPRYYLTVAEASMANRVKQAMSDLRGAGTTMFSFKNDCLPCTALVDVGHNRRLEDPNAETEVSTDWDLSFEEYLEECKNSKRLLVRTKSWNCFQSL